MHSRAAPAASARSVFTWVVCTMGAAAVANSFGLNIQPLLTVGGAGGVIAAFASQQVLTNVVNGLSLVGGAAGHGMAGLQR